MGGCSCGAGRPSAPVAVEEHVLFSSSRFRLVRAMGRARHSITASGVVRPIPAWVFLYYVLMESVAWALCLSACFTCIRTRGVSESDGGHLPVALLCASIVLHLPTDVILLCPLSYATQFLGRGGGCQPMVRKGSRLRVKGIEDALENPGATSRSVSPLLALALKRKVTLVDGDIRQMMFVVRALIKVVFLLVNLTLGLLIYLGKVGADDRGIQAVFVATNVLMVLFTCEYASSAMLGIQYSASYTLSRGIIARRRRLSPVLPFNPEQETKTNPVTPADPRAASMQQLLIGLLVILPSVLKAIAMTWPGSFHPVSQWVLPSVALYLTAVVSFYGGVCHLCPVSAMVGLLVESGVVPKPFSRLDEDHDVLTLCYGLWGPIITMEDGPKIVQNRWFGDGQEEEQGRRAEEQGRRADPPKGTVAGQDCSIPGTPTH